MCNGNTPTVAITWPLIDDTDHWVDLGIYYGFKQYSSKNVPKGQLTTTAPAGFSPTLTLNPGTTYYVRVYYPSTGTRTSPVSFIAPKCEGGSTSYPTYQCVELKHSENPKCSDNSNCWWDTTIGVCLSKFTQQENVTSNGVLDFYYRYIRYLKWIYLGKRT